MNFLDSLRESVKSAGLKNVADKSGLTERYLYIFIKKDSQPSFETVVKICKALNIKNIKVV